MSINYKQYIVKNKARINTLKINYEYLRYDQI